jgi:hypothetical protein
MNKWNREIKKSLTDHKMVWGVLVAICLGVSGCAPAAPQGTGAPASLIATITQTSISSSVPNFTPTPEPTLPVLQERSTTDRADDVNGYQVHIMYVVPSDGVDRHYDTNGFLDISVASFEKWMSLHTGGRQFRMDTYQGALDISFFRLAETDAQVASHGAFVREQIQMELNAAGFNKPEKLYAVYYDGTSTFSCGGSAWPPTITGDVTTLYLKGAYGSVHCTDNAFTSSVNSPGIQEFSMLQEIFQTLGAAALCAPHEIPNGKVSDSNADILYGSSLPWRPSKIDVGNDDYFDTKNPNCLDIAKSVFIDPLPANAVPPPSWR